VASSILLYASHWFVIRTWIHRFGVRVVSAYRELLERGNDLQKVVICLSSQNQSRLMSGSPRLDALLVSCRMSSTIHWGRFFCMLTCWRMGCGSQRLTAAPV